MKDKVQSFLVKQPGTVQHMVFDTVFNQIHFACAIGLGDFSGDEAQLSSTGQGAMNALAEYTKIFKSTAFHLVPITSQQKAEDRIPTVFFTAEPNSAIFFICKTSQIYDFVTGLLGIQQYSPFEASSH